MRIVLILLALVYFILKIIFVDRYQEKYFIVDYFEAIDFVSSYYYEPVKFVNKNVLPYFDVISIRLKSLNELKSEGLVDLADSKTMKTNPKFWLLPFLNYSFEKDKSFIYCPEDRYLPILENVLRKLKLNFEKKGNVFIVQVDSKYLFSLQVFLLIDNYDFNRIFQGKRILWRVSSYVYDLDYLSVYCRRGDMILFTGPFVGGYPDNLDKVNEFIKKQGLIFVFPEFYDSKSIQLGSPFLSRDGGIKLFSIFTVRNKSINEIVNSVGLAIEERNCQSVFFRFLDRYSLKENIELIKKIKNIYFSDSYLTGLLGNLEDRQKVSSGVNNVLILIGWVNLIVFVFFVLMAYSYYHDLLVSNGYRVNLLFFLVLSIFNSVLIVVFKILKAYLLFNLLVVVGISFVLIMIFFRVFGQESKNIYQKYFEVLLLTVSLGIIVNSLFFEYNYLVGVQKVGFIKVLLILPVLLSIFAVFSYNQLVLFFYRRLKLLDLVVILVLFAGLGFYLIRSGNTGFVLPFEDKIRYFLDKVLIARPRFKEFLIGNPSILLSSYSKIFIPFSFISLGGIVDSFLHIHTPIFYSFLRTFWGALLGLLVFLLINKYWKRLKGKTE